MSKREGPPKSQLDPQPLWSTAVDALLRVEADLELSAEEAIVAQSAAAPAWLQEVMSEYGASPPVELVADHYAELGEQEQAGLFAELNETCGFDYAAEVVTLAKKRSGESARKSAGGDSGAPD